MNRLLVLLLATCLITACSDSEKRKTIEINDENFTSYQLKMDSVLADTTKVITTGLPVLIDSTRNILIHEVKVEETDKKNSRFDMYSKKADYDTGYKINLIFEEQTTDTKRTLTDISLRIYSYSYQSDLYKRTGKNYIFYTVVDNDTNRDGILDYKDIESFYISNIDGTSFDKITKNNENYKDGKLILPQKRYYFKTVTDSNGDGYFNNLDEEHFYYIDFNGETYYVKEYSPLDILNI